MSKVNIQSAGGGSLSTGLLQLQNGVAMSTTLTAVTDQSNTASPLRLSTTVVQTLSKLQITTADSNYIDAEDNSGNNRFTVGRDPSSQIVNIDFASNPTGLTQMVGGIRTYTDGVNLGTIMSFRKDGNIGIGTSSPTARTQIVGSGSTSATTSLLVQDSSSNNLMNLRDDGLLDLFSSSKTGQLVVNGGSSSGIFTKAYNSFSDNIIRYKDWNSNTCMILTMTGSGSGNLTINNSTTSLNATLGVKGSGSTSATTSLLVQNSGGTELFRVYDNGQINLLPLNGAVGSPANFVANGNDLSFRCGYYFRFLTSGDNKIVFGSSWDGSNTYVYNENRQVIGANAINASAQLQVDSTTKGFLPPRMTEAQILAIASPAIGLMAYNTDKDCPVFYSAAGWRKISHSAM